jgi:putative membrane protein
MILRDRPSGLRLFFVWRGSILPRVWRQIVAATGLAALTTLFRHTLAAHSLIITPIPFSLIGLALSIFLGFRNSAAYDRYWEGRKLWGELVIVGRALARQILSYIGDAAAGAALRRRMVYGTIAFAHALRHHLRGTDPLDDLRGLVDPADLGPLAASHNRPDFLVRRLGRDLRTGLDQGLIGERLAQTIDASLTRLDGVLAGCERIKTTPIPFSYSLLLHRTAHIYCFMLPFGLVDSIGLMTPVVVAVVSYTFFGLDAVGDEIEEPFGLLPNDLPLAAISRAIEITLREALGEPDLPPPVLPEDYCLL